MRNLKLWWKFEGRYYHKDLIQGIKNLWKWFPIVWKDRDYDHAFIYDILKFKLEKQANYISKHDRHTRAKRDAETMLLCTRLIERCVDDFYGMEYMDYHVSNFNFVDITDDDNIPEKYRGSKKLEIEEISENFDEYFKKYPIQYKRVLSGEINRYGNPISEKDKKNIAMEIAHENQNRCQNLLFKIMGDNINKWWD